MINSNAALTKLFSIRNQYGKEVTLAKQQLLNSISIKNINSKKAAQSLYAALLFLQAYPDNKTICKKAGKLLLALNKYVKENKNLQYQLYNSGITGTIICAAFGFEITKWLQKTQRGTVKFNSFENSDEQIKAFISVVMNKAESEVFQDGNAEWKGWLKRMSKPGESILDQLIDIFESSNIRPEVKDEIWNAIGVNVEIDLQSPCCLPASLTNTFYHRALIRKEIMKEPLPKLVAVKLTDAAAQQIIDCSKMILVRHLREIDPISFTAAKLVSYYHLPRGISIALMSMVTNRRNPIDSYMGYTVFKNGLPVAYAGSWILFNSGRIGLNIFPDYRGGETRFIFEQVLHLHTQVYNLKRFTVDPYQIGKDNSDGIQSGAFWVYYHAGFRPFEKMQKQLAESEAAKIQADKNYRSPKAVLKTLAQSRLEMVLKKTTASFDATDMSQAYANIILKKYYGNRLLAQRDAAKKLAAILQIKNYQDDTINFVLKSWAVFLLCKQKELVQNPKLKSTLKNLFTLKATGSEEAYITALQKTPDLQKLVEDLVDEYAIDLNH